MLQACTLIITGAMGRLGRVLQRHWAGRDDLGFTPLWAARKPGQGIDIVWDMSVDLPPALPRGAVFLHLAGVTQGTPGALAENGLAAQNLCRAARDAMARQVFIMSSVAVYRPGAHIIDENVAPDPTSDYGRAKLAAELAARAVLPSVTVLRLGNVAGSDALLGHLNPNQTMQVDPVAAQNGPVRSYIGPQVLADTLAQLTRIAATGAPLPAILHLAQQPAVAMGDLLDAAGQPWQFGPIRAATVPRVCVSTGILTSMMPMPPATPASLVADMIRSRAPK